MFGIFSTTKKTAKKEVSKNSPPCSMAKKVKDVPDPPNLKSEPCPSCGKPLVVRRNTSTGALFVGCSGWPACSQETYDVGKHTHSTKGNRGIAELANGTKIYYAESYAALKGYGRGIKHGDIGIIKKHKRDDAQILVYDDCDGWILGNTENFDIAEDIFDADSCWDDDDDDEFFDDI